MPGMRAILNESNWDKLAKLELFANEHGHSVGELALAWLLAKPWLASVIAGARKPDQITANVNAAKWKLSADETKAVDAITA